MEDKKVLRKTAIERLSTPEQLDALMQVASPAAWLGLLAAAILVTALVIWGFFSEIPSTVEAFGYLAAGDLTQPDSFEALIYLPIPKVQGIKEGMEVHVSPLNAPTQQYGYMIGKITTLDVALATDAVAQSFAKDGEPVVRLKVTLEKESGTPTGYRWTVGKGLDTPLRDGLSCRAEIIIRRERPISRVFPMLEGSDG